MRKFFLFFAALCCAVMVSANGTKIGDLYYILNSDGTASVTYETFNSNNYASLTQITIPSTVTYDNQSYTVTAIGNSAFKSAANLTRFEFQDNNAVTLIDESAFQDCEKLQSFYIPFSQVRTIGKRAFKNCVELFCNLPGSLETIGDYAFAGCKRLNCVNSGLNLQTIGREAFSGATNLQAVILPQSLESIGIMAFKGCTSLRYFVVRKNTLVALNPDNAVFSGVDVSAVALQVPYALKNDYTNAAVWSQFKLTPYVQQSDIYYTVDDETQTAAVTFERYDDSHNYYYSLGTSEVVIDDAVLVNHVSYPVEKIDDYAFYSSFITKLTLPDNVKEIGDHAVENCHSLTEIHWPASLERIRKYAFSSCTELTEVNLPDQVQSLDYGAFLDCTKVQSVSLPASLTQFGRLVFRWCDELATVTNYATTPQDIADKDLFQELNTAAITLRVPQGSLAAYQNAPVWQDFNIVEFDPHEGIDDVQSDKVQGTKVIKGGQLLIERNGKTYNALGAEVQ